MIAAQHSRSMTSVSFVVSPCNGVNYNCFKLTLIRENISSFPNILPVPNFLVKRVC
jgi:hypothetical protein